jgi:hypothetical protein
MTSLRLRLLAQTLPFLLAIPGVALAQAGPPTRAEAEAALNPGAPAATAYTPQQIDQMVAPIALYPDQLLSQVLMAATYPQQLLDAAQWLQDPNNAALKGDALAAALQPLPWDPSVKALVAFPQIVMMLAQHIDWTQALGVAFATQQPLVMAQIQQLRHLAMRAGLYRHFEHLVFRDDAGEIVIAAEAPDEIYVPVYNPAVVYGSYWPAPDYPPVYVPPPPDFVSATIIPGIELSVGYAVVAPLWGWSHPDWRHHWIAINRTDYTRITRNIYIGPGGAWRHQGPLTIVPPAEAARFSHAQAAAAAPKGTVEPARAAAVAALPRRAAAEPNRIHTAPSRPETTAAAPEHGAAPSGSPAHPGARQALIPPAGHEAMPGPAAASGREAPPPTQHPEEHAAIKPAPAPHAAAAPHPSVTPRPEEHAAIRPAPGVAHPAPPHPAAAPRPEVHAAIRPAPAPHAAAAPHPSVTPRPEEHAAIRPAPGVAHPAPPHPVAAAPHPAPAPHPAAAAPRPAPPPRQAAAAHPPAAPKGKPPEKKE